MKVREWYMDALIKKHYSLQLLIEFLVHEKKAISFEDDDSKLKYFQQERFKNKMNEYLIEYNSKRNLVKEIKEIQVYQVRKNDTFYFIAAYSKEQAENFFKSKYGEFKEIRIELPELLVEGENGTFSLKHIMMNTKNFPSVLGQWELLGGDHEQIRTANNQVGHRHVG